MSEVAEVVEYLPAVREPAPVTLFRTDEPSEVVKRATATANELAKVVRDKKLTTNIQGREHVRIEGWALLGTMLGVFPICVWTRQMEDGWEARVEARTLTGAVVGAAEAQCLRHETNWRSRDDFALRSMAQTRAAAKALRVPLGFVMTLAGYESTPYEEMVVDSVAPTVRRTAAKPQPSGDGITEAQGKLITNLIEKLPPEQREEEVTRIQANHRVATVGELSKKDASTVISRLKGEDAA